MELKGFEEMKNSIITISVLRQRFFRCLHHSQRKFRQKLIWQDGKELIEPKKERKSNLDKAFGKSYKSLRPKTSRETGFIILKHCLLLHRIIFFSSCPDIPLFFLGISRAKSMPEPRWPLPECCPVQGSTCNPILTLK